jgi:predicted esterase
VKVAYWSDWAQGRVRRTLIVVIAMMSLAAGACGNTNESGSGADADSPEATETTTATTSPTTAATEAPTVATQSPTTLVDDPVPEAFGVGVREVTFIDTARQTPPSGEAPGTEERVLDTVVLYPTVGDPTGTALSDAEPAIDQAPFPLVIFSHGLGGSPESYQPLLERWVSAGFMVVAPRFPLSRPDAPAGPEAGDVQNQAGDVTFLIDSMVEQSADTGSPFAGLVDGDHVGASGHSQGAITTIGATLHSCCVDERIDAAISMAGTPSPFAGGAYDFEAAPPYLIVHGTEDALVDYAVGVSLYNDLPGPKGLLELDGGGHSAMLDTGEQWFEEVVAVTNDFWMAYLLDDAEALVRLAADPAEGGYPDLRWSSGDGPQDVITTTTIPGIDRAVTAEPTVTLSGGDVVTVTWAGFTPGGTINVVQCAGEGTSGAGFCDLVTGHILVANPTGAGALQLEIVVGPVGQGECVAGSTDCVILVNDSGLTEPDATFLLPLDFAE